MASYTVYPDAIDGASQLPVAVDNVTPVKAEVVNRQRSAILAIESELGLQPSGTYATVRARLDDIDNLIRTLVGDVSAISLASVLAVGNGTGGHDIIVASGDSVKNAAGTVSLSDRLCVDSLCMEELAANPYSPVSGRGTIWLRNDNTLIYTDDTGADHDLISGAETLAATLALGNTTGGTDIVITSGDGILGADGGVSSAGADVTVDGGAGGSSSGDGGNLTFRGGLPTDGNGGGISISGRTGAGTNRNGGLITVTGGDATGTGTPGTVTITGGGGDSNAGANVSIIGGASTSNNQGTVILDGYTIDVADNLITSVATPINLTDAVNKKYVDNLVSSAGEVIFRLSGVYSELTLPAFVDAPHVTLDNTTLESATIVRRYAGTSGLTRVDLLKNGTSIFTADSDKPQITYSSGDSVYNTAYAFADSGAFSAGDFLDVVVDSVETALTGPPDGPEGISVILRFGNVAYPVISSPLAVSGLTLWLDSSDLTDGYVTSWPDKSGNAYDASGSGTNGVIYQNERPLMQMNGVDDEWVTPNVDWSAVNDFTKIIVYKTLNTSADQCLIEKGYSAYPFTSEGSLISYDGTTSRLQSIQYSAGNNYNTRIIDATSDDNTSLIIRTMLADRSQAASGEQSFHSSGGICADILSFGGNASAAGLGNNPFWIGRRSVGTLPLDGYIAEVLVYDRKLPDDESRSVSIYLAKKWGLPYRSLMPVGDSITYGDGSDGWRGTIFAQTKFEPRGNVTAGPGVYRHEGHPGNYISNINSNIATYWLSARSREILLTIGTNDALTPALRPDMLTNYETLLTTMDSLTPAPTRIWCATLTPLSDSASNDAVNTFNAGIAAVVAGHPLCKLVDIGSSITTADLADGIHPNSGGFAKMGAAWLAAIKDDF